MRRMEVGWTLTAVWCLYNFLHVSSANDVNCTVTQGADQTTYRVPDVKASHCEYSWANTSGLSTHVLANHYTKMDELVKNSTISALITCTCFDNIIYTRNCVSEGSEYKANCTTNCNENIKRQKDTYKVWIAAVVIVLLVLIGLAGVLCCRCAILKKTCCCHCGGTYTVAKMQKNNLNMADVETGNE